MSLYKCVDESTGELFEGMQHMYRSEIMQRINQHTHVHNRVTTVDLTRPLRIVKEVVSNG